MDLLGLWSWIRSNLYVLGPFLATLAVLVLALGSDGVQSWFVRRRRRAAEWRAVEYVIADRGFGEREARFLRVFLRNYAPATPMQILSERGVFDSYVERAMADVAGERNEAAYREQGVMLRVIRQQLGFDQYQLGQPIESTRGISVRQTIWASPGHESSEGWFRLVVAKVDEAYCWVTPVDLPRGLRPHQGLALHCRLWREEDARYVFTSELADLETIPGQWALRHARDLSRIQSRSHYRVAFERETTVGLVPAPPDGATSHAELRQPAAWIPGRFVSLSAAGYAVIVDQPISNFVVLRTTVDPSDGEKPFETTARIVDATPLGGESYRVRAAFVGLEEAQRDRIAHYVLTRQQHRIAWHTMERQPGV